MKLRREKYNLYAKHLQKYTTCIKVNVNVKCNNVMRGGINMYKIDEVTKQVGLTKRTLRYYEEIGLIYPPERSEGNIRLYTDEDIVRIKKIVEAKEVLGITLQEMQHFLSLKERMEQRRNSDNPRDREVIQEIKDMLENQVQTLDTKMKQMERVKAELENSLGRARKFLEDTKGE